MEKKDRFEQVRATYDNIREKFYAFRLLKSPDLIEVKWVVSTARQLSEEIRNTIIPNNESVYIEKYSVASTHNLSSSAAIFSHSSIYTDSLFGIIVLRISSDS